MNQVMRAVTWVGPGEMTLADVPVPTLGTDDVLVRVTAASACGSDISGFKGTLGNRFPGQIMGHEIAGSVVAAASPEHFGIVGSAVVVNPLETCGSCRECAAGRPQRCGEGRLIGVHRHGGFAEFVAVRASNALPSPLGLPPERACLVEPMAHAFHDVRVASVEGDLEDLLIIGAGPIGLFALIAAQAIGIPSLTVIEPDQGRREMARSLGATAVASRDELTGLSFGAVIEGVGLETTRQDAVDLARRGGTVVLVGLAQPRSELGFMGALVREVVMRGAFAYGPQDFDDARAYLGDGGLPPQFSLDVAQLEEAPDVFRRLASGPQPALKAVFLPPLGHLDAR
jgi:2-desacetyl-2-hydroxyethyl bacteriochlorophyllide A dehydrogenase